MKAFTTTLHFISTYGKIVHLNVTLDSHDDLFINWLKIDDTYYDGKKLTARRESVVIAYAAQFFDLHKWMADEIAERETHIVID